MPLSRTDRGDVDQAYAGPTSTDTLTSAAFTPASGALLLALHSEFTNDASHSVTFGAPAGWGVTWTKIERSTNDGGNYYNTAIGYGFVTGASPASGSATIQRRAGSFYMSQFGTFVEISGVAATPIADSVSNVDSGSGSLAVNLAGTPAAGSYLFSVCQDDTGGGSPTVPSSFTLLGRSSAGDGSRHATAELLGSGVQNNSWTTLNNYHNVAILAVVAEALGQPYIKRVGGHPFAPGRNVGSTIRRF